MAIECFEWTHHAEVRLGDGKTFAVVYDNPVKRDPNAARVLSAWPLRREKRT